MDTPRDPCISDRPQVVGVDSLWFDPRLLTAACSVQLTDLPLVNAVVQSIAPANARRVMIGFAQPAVGVQHQYAPWPDVSLFALSASASLLLTTWFSLFNFGPIVCNNWYCRPAATANLRVVEIIRN